MNMAEPPGTPRHSRLAIIALALAGGLAAAEPPPKPEVVADDNEITSLAAYNVKADLIEDFGLRVQSARYPASNQLTTITTVWFAKYAPEITAVLPNTAAARAGLQPGERILKSEGRSLIGGPFSREQWDKIQRKKWAEVAAGKTDVAWTLEVETPATKAVRTVKLVVPTPAPHWGATHWHRPEGRSLGGITETGPLAERSRAVLDNGVWTLLGWPASSISGDHATLHAGPVVTGYEWHFGDSRRGLRQMTVAPMGDHTDILFEIYGRSVERHIYLTSPSGKLEKAWRWTRKENIALMKAKTMEAMAKVGVLSLEEARAGFEAELDFWTTKVVPGTGRWPFELKAGYDLTAVFPAAAGQGEAPAALAAEFLKLRPATAAERALFDEAYGKLGLDAENWAYTETSRSIEDQRVLVTRIDPSRSGPERDVLVSINGKAPTAAEVQAWRDLGGDQPKPLGELPPLGDVLDLKDLRVLREEAGAVVFELPLQGDGFPRDKFQALVRVNTARRALEEITVKLRAATRLAGVIKLSEAGLQVRFATPDPARPPQPVYLRSGGTARVLLMKVSRAFEATRTDFRRVEPYAEAESP